MTAHDHPTFVSGCYRCDLSREEEMDAQTDQVAEMRQVLGDLFMVWDKVHHIYSNTSVCRGGIGGQMITSHCAWDCENPVHAEDNDRMRDLLIKARYLWEEGQ